MTLKESAQYTGYAVYHFRRLAAPYYRYMSCDSPDLAEEAQLAVYQVSSVLIDPNKDLSLTSRYFRIVFRTRCIQLAAGVALANGPAANVAVKKNNPPSLLQSSELDDAVISEALFTLTGRQRLVSLWIPSQPRPVNFNMIIWPSMRGEIMSNDQELPQLLTERFAGELLFP
jgi:hypothetical protein